MTTLPAGVPSPFEKQAWIVSAAAANSCRGVPDATCAFQMRAPSRCRWTVAGRAARSASTASTGTTQPPWKLFVFSTRQSVVRDRCTFSPRTSAATASGSGVPRVLE